MKDTLSNNLKELRLQKLLTQEQVAEMLCVSSQTVSRWERGSSLPDALILPDIAKLYCVTVDDLFRESPRAYANLFQRLARVHIQTLRPEDFVRADAEFMKMQENDSISNEDLRLYALMHQHMMFYCKNKTIKLYDEVINNGQISPDESYFLAKCAKANFLTVMGNPDDFIAEQLKAVSQKPSCADELWVLLYAMYYAKRYDEAYEHYIIGKRKFPDSGKILAVGGDICRKLKRYDEAFKCWDKALKLDCNLLTSIESSKAFCYEELGDYEKAYELRLKIVKELKAKGLDVDAEIEGKRAEKCFKKIQM